MPAQYQLRKSINNQYYFNLTADNNEPILTSETYVSKFGADEGIQSCRKNSPLDSQYSRLKSTDNKFYFLLKAANNETIGKSETYNSQQAMEIGIQAVKKVGPTAPIIDLT
jgi:hypothetical protein